MRLRDTPSQDRSLVSQAHGNPALLIGEEQDHLVADANAARNSDISIPLGSLRAVHGVRSIDRRHRPRDIRILGRANYAVFRIALGWPGAIGVAQRLDAQPR